MNKHLEELEEIIDNLGNKDNYIEEFGYQYKRISLYDSFQLLDYITDLQQKVDLYENPDDMTLFYMWLDEKSKDKMKQLRQENERLNNMIYREISDYILKKYGMLDDTHYHDFLNELELKESSNNE